MREIEKAKELIHAAFVAIFVEPPEHSIGEWLAPDMRHATDMNSTVGLTSDLVIL